MVNVGDGTSPSYPNATMISRASVVLPAPNPPDNATTSPGRSRTAIRAPKAAIAGRSGSSTFICRRSWQVNRHGSTGALLRSHVEPTTVRLDQLAGERQAEAASATVRPAVGPDAVAIERSSQLARLHAATVVRNDDPSPLLAPRQRHENAALARRRVDRVVEDVADRPTELARVGHDLARSTIAAQVERQTLRFDRLFTLAHDLRDQRQQLDLLGRDRQQPCLALGQVEDAFDLR